MYCLIAMFFLNYDLLTIKGQQAVGCRHSVSEVVDSERVGATTFSHPGGM